MTIKMGTDDEMRPGELFPVMYCRKEKLPDGTAVWTFLCPHCCRRHMHSAGPGHRVAHCHDPASPFARDGYVLALAPKKKRTARQP
jgi:hypothetical protein